MSVETVLEAVRTLSIDDQRLVVETIIDELGVDPDLTVISEAEKELIEKRLTSYRVNPERVRPFEEVVERIRAKLSQ